MRKGVIESAVFIIIGLVVFLILTLLAYNFYRSYTYGKVEEIVLEGDESKIARELAKVAADCWRENALIGSDKWKSCALVRVIAHENLSKEKIIEEAKLIYQDIKLVAKDIPKGNKTLQVFYDGKIAYVKILEFSRLTDGVCRTDLGENCKFPDCECKISNICEPFYDEDKINEKGCVKPEFINYKGIGEECRFEWECIKALNCTQTINFYDYERACCPAGKGWNGTECIKLLGTGEACEADIECKQGLKCNLNSTKNGKACCPDGLHWNGKDCVFLEGEKCTEIGKCDNGLQCKKPVPDSNITGNYCCPPGKRWNGTECVSTFKDAYFIVYVPISYSPSEFEEFKSVSLKSFEVWYKQKSPFKECSDPGDRVKPYFIKPEECPELQRGCSHICGDCNFIAVRCARKANLPKEIVLGTNAIVSGICKGNSCPGACGCAAAAPSIVSVSNTGICRGRCSTFQGYEVPLHEMGHSWGFHHVECKNNCVACQACPGYVNCPDCKRPERAQFIMDYCSPMGQYGPAAYDHLKKLFKKYLEGC